MSTINGTPLNDTLSGTAGDDVMSGESGDDVILAGDGNDRVNGGAGDDFIKGEGGDDILVGGDGLDRISGGAGHDYIRGDGDNDVLRGDDGDDRIHGGLGNDRLFGDSGADRLDGEDGNDWLFGGAGADRLFGGTGADGLRGGIGADILNGGDGNDILRGEDDNDILYGDAGIDRLYGDAGNDTLYGGADRDVLNGGSGDDHLEGEGGDDTLLGGLGNDTALGGLGNDVIYGHDGNDTLEGGDGADFISGDAGDDILRGGAGDDRLYGRNGHDIIEGGDGNDVAEGNGGNDIFTGGAGDDRFDGGGWLGDRAVFSGNAADYQLQYFAASGMVVVTDLRPGSPDGQDRLFNVELLQFADGFIGVNAGAFDPLGDIPRFTSAASAAFAENGTGTAYTAAATDDDGDTMSYSLSGTDSALFNIDSVTGEVTFVAPPDFENPGDADGDNVYLITVTADDGTSSTDQLVSITVTDAEEAPEFGSANAVSVAEGSTAAFTAQATDPEGATVTYSLSGTDAGLFSIDANSGEVSFTAPPDYENPGDNGGDNVYNITVTASDGVNTADQAVSVSVTNINDNNPVITSSAAQSVSEGSIAAFTATATDADGDTITYSLGGTDAALFTIDANTGEVEFVSAPDFESPGDGNGDNDYELTITASDGVNTDVQNVTVSVTDVAEAGAPVFQSAASANVSEAQTSAYVAVAVDNEGDTITYSLSGTDAALFSINSATGEVSFNTPADFETPADGNGDNVYEFTVIASDGSQSDTLDVSVNVSDVTEGAELPQDNTTEIQMVSGGDFVGSLETIGDRDWIAIELEAGQRYQFDLFGSGAGGGLEDPLIRLYDAAGNLVAENDDISLGVERDSRLAFTAQESGTYYISAGSYDDGYSGQYTLQVRHTDPLREWSYQEIAEYLNQNGFGGLQWNKTSGDTITVNLTALTTDGQTLARAALQLWTDVTGINFQEVISGGEIVFDDSEEGAFAGPDTVSGGFITSASVNVGTGWLSTYGSNLDGYSFQTYIHEIGHALGLGHSGPYNGSADYAVDAIFLNDSWQATVMSYFSQNENTYVDASFGYVISPQVADILAVQTMYGTPTGTRSGDTVYGYNSTAGNSIFDATAFSNPVSYTIFDAGGVDTLDFSGYVGAQTLDLREGNYSSVQGRTGNVGIAIGTVIENAIGGSGNDILIGNDANNVLTGNAGNDTFVASGGSDVFVGGAGIDIALFSGTASDYTLTTNGSGNTVVTDNRVGAPDGTVELIGVETIQYDGEASNPDYFAEPLGDKGTAQDWDASSQPTAEGGNPSTPGFVDKEGGPRLYPGLSPQDLALLRSLSDSTSDDVLDLRYLLRDDLAALRSGEWGLFDELVEIRELMADIAESNGFHSLSDATAEAAVFEKQPTMDVSGTQVPALPDDLGLTVAQDDDGMLGIAPTEEGWL